MLYLNRPLYIYMYIYIAMQHSLYDNTIHKHEYILIYLFYICIFIYTLNKVPSFRTGGSKM